MATDNASSRDSAVIDDDLVEALGFEPTSTTKIVDDTETDSDSDSLDVLSDDDRDVVPDTAETDLSVADVESAVADSPSETQSVVILGDSSATSAVDAASSELSEVAPTRAPKRRSLFGTRRSQEPTEVVSTPEESSGDAESTLGADDFIEELLAGEDAEASVTNDEDTVDAASETDLDTADLDSAETVSPDPDALDDKSLDTESLDTESLDTESLDTESLDGDTADVTTIDESETLVLDDIDLDLTDSDVLVDSDLVDLTELDLAEDSADTSSDTSADTDSDSEPEASLESPDEPARGIDPVTTESAFPEVPALTELDQGAAAGADMFTQPVEVEKLDAEKLGAKPDLLALDDVSESTLTTITDTPDNSAGTETAPSAVSSPVRRRTRVRAKKSRRVIRHVDPWSVLTFSALFHLALYTAFLLASVLVWEALEASGKVEDIESLIRALGDFETYEINADVLFRVGVIVAGILTVASTILSVLFCVVFNLISDLVGGIRVTVLEEETVRVPAKNKSPKTK